MEIDYTSQAYKTVSTCLQNHRRNGESWESIASCSFSMGETLEERLKGLSVNLGINIEADYWLYVIEREKEEEKFGVDTKVIFNPVMIPVSDATIFDIDEDKGSCWYAYKKKLYEKNFDKESILDIQDSAHKILNKLSLDTRNCDPVKGLVIGNVQSGKTANMAGLMAMAADAGFNFFLVLSGTIESLRKQTEDRLYNDLSSATRKRWSCLQYLSGNVDVAQKLSSLRLNDDDTDRYCYVCLKNSTRLKNLLIWLNKDSVNRQKIKMLIIDDEADIAGINTKAEYIEDVNINDAKEKDERNKINQYITSIFANEDHTKKPIAERMKAINYVAFTATPYANILNEQPGPKSMYPSNFVASLSVPKSYIGPQHIFGLSGTNVDGMHIINAISQDEEKQISNIYKRVTWVLPKSMKDAILWFYCCFAIRKYRQENVPVSMLIHTSQKQINHEIVADLVARWINKFDAIEFVEECRKIYEKETAQFGVDDFKYAYRDYSKPNIKDYPKFEEISNVLLEIFNHGVSSIKIDDQNNIVFSKGVHLCIDNCSHNGIENEDEHIRLLYPENELDYTTGFIVIGGATLSRGLTIEGLVCSYFLRTVKMADSLMQMGRWFGFRIGYEILPRIWMTDKTKDAFEFLSMLDSYLRDELSYMERNDIKPKYVAPKIMYNPNTCKIMVTAKNKQHQAVPVKMDFSGIATGTTIFYSDEEKLKSNFDITSEFLNSLGKPIDTTNHIHAENSLIWNDIDDNKVISYLENMQYPNKQNSFLDLKLFKKWYEEISAKTGATGWNIVVSGLENPSKEDLIDMGNLKVCKVNRSCQSVKQQDGHIRIGALRAVKDLYADIDISKAKLTIDDIHAIKNNISKDFRGIRKRAGLKKNSLLIIYVIDKDSKPENQEKNRTSMNTKNHVIGLMMVIPDSGESDKGKNFVSIKIDPDKYLE